MDCLATKVVTGEGELSALVDEMSSLADEERLALGFWPKSALMEAIKRKSVIALVLKDGAPNQLIGYIHHSDTFPHAKIQQIAVKQEHRRQGRARALLNVLVSALERQGYLSIRADIASDLQESLRFYRANGFVEAFKKVGGKARKREIIVHERSLDTDDLFSLSDRSRSLELGIKRRSAGDRPIYAIDLNVYFDLVRDRTKSEFARRIFGAALAHEVRLAVASEFATELQRTSLEALNDPILQMALRLPVLPTVEPKRLQSVADYVHTVAFVQTGSKGAGTPQALSDAKHVAHAALARASGFVTRDGTLLAARERLLEALGIDLISTKELEEILPKSISSTFSQSVGQGFTISPVNQEQLVRFLQSSNVNEVFLRDVREQLWVSDRIFCEGAFVSGTMVAAGFADCPRDTHRASKFLLFAEPSYTKASIVCDFLLNRMMEVVGDGKPLAIQLANIPGQSIVGSIARSKGFSRSKAGDVLEKFSLGHPLTFDNWTNSATELRRCTGLRIPSSIGQWDPAAIIDIGYPSGETLRLSLGDLELLLGPTVLIYPSLNGVLVPIGRSFADELLGTGNQSQFAFVENKDAAFTSRRGYVNSPQRSALFQPDSPILFYESINTGGRGGVVAIARIADSLILRKDEVDVVSRRQLVVDDVSQFSASERVLLTSFDNLMRAPRLTSLRKLREMGAVDGSNLVSARSVSASQISAIVQESWGRFG